jgi:DNA repair protein RadC
MGKSYFEETDFFSQRNPTPTHEGHRQRVYKRYDNSGVESLSDHEVLELLLFFVHARRDTKPFAKELLLKLGSLEKVFSTPSIKLEKIKGVGKSGARLISLVYQITVLLNKQALAQKKITISSHPTLITYLKSAMGTQPIEQVRILLLDSKNNLVKDLILSKGSETQAHVAPREVLKKVLNYDATAFILVHNHPSGDTTPSNEDIRLTRNLYAAANTLGLAMFDHIIIGNTLDSFYSFREKGVI